MHTDDSADSLSVVIPCRFLLIWVPGFTQKFTHSKLALSSPLSLPPAPAAAPLSAGSAAPAAPTPAAALPGALAASLLPLPAQARARVGRSERRRAPLEGLEGRAPLRSCGGRNVGPAPAVPPGWEGRPAGGGTPGVRAAGVRNWPL